MVKMASQAVLLAILAISLLVFPGCGNKGPPTLPKPDSLVAPAQR
ncbi:hypothetical protein MNBD_NITROSPINAE04-1201 [hydrothermal vent metagenome]|uniref:Lipoprotein n=1 Tax=hydrothermal vent metagenome TaxID=652676 RepID=A0A3B1BYZ8_9ZZZZ